MRLGTTTMLFVLALVLVHPRAEGKEIAPLRITVEQAQQLLKTLYGREVDCTNKVPCTVDIPVTVIQFKDDDDKLSDYCLAQFPSKITYRNAAPGNPRKRIVWNVSTVPFKAPSGKTYRFEFNDENGIILLTNPAWQITRGGQGDGAGSYDSSSYFARNWHRAARVEAVYVPVLMFVNVDDSSDVGVCGTGDPRIVNN